MGSALRLESFDDAVQADEADGITYQQGYDAGLAAAQAAADLEQVRLQAELVQAIGDLEFTYSEARGALTQSLAPLFEVIAQVILPHCINAGLAGHIATVLQAAAATNLSGPLQVAVHPGQRDAVAAALEAAHPGLTVIADDGLSPHTAWIKAGNQETLVDLDRTLSEIIAILGAIDPLTTRQETHGR